MESPINDAHLWSDEPHIQNIIDKINEKLNLIINDDSNEATVRKKTLWEIKIYAQHLYFMEKNKQNN